VFLVVGLGNPGNRYRKTKHNLGFMVVENLAAQWNKRFKKGKGFSQVIETFVGSQKVILAKPITYMYKSGKAVDDLLMQYHVDLSHLIIVCDDFNLSLGKIRLRKKGSHGGHKGLTSIIHALGTQEFPRLRLGIGLISEIDASEFVLSPFRPSELPSVNTMIEKGAQVLTDFILKGIDWTMNSYN